MLFLRCYALLFIFFISCQTVKDPNGSSLASTAEVNAEIERIKKAGKMVEADIEKIFAATGGNVSHSEGMAIFRFFKGQSGFQVPPEMLQKALDYALVWKLKPKEQKALQKRISLNGEPIPEEVIRILSWARLAGAIPYDVSSTSGGNFTPYEQSRRPKGSLAWDYTQITPKSLKADMDDRTVVNKIIETSPSIKYTKSDCANGRGSIISRYDERSVHSHTDTFARGENCQKWANNCAIMYDGSLHCLPASRRQEGTSLILTNPSLGRRKHMLFNGHINARNGVITYVGMSGRIAKQAADPDGKPFVDATALIKAWGIKVNPGVTTQSEHYGTSRDFLVHGDTFTVRSRR